VKRYLALATLIVAFWPVWLWYLQRWTDQSDEPLGILALVTLFALNALKRGAQSPLPIKDPPIAAIAGPPVAAVADPPAASVALLAVYSLSWPWVPKVVHAVLALIVTGLLISSITPSPRCNLGNWILLLLSLPIVASLNFVFGYPLRLLVSVIAAPLLSVNGFPAFIEGTTITWSSHMVEIDAPCSGIKMLWLSTFLAAALSSLCELSLARGALLLLLSGCTAIAANVLRVTSLFYIEAGIIAVPPQLHDLVHQGVGVAVFALLAGAILWTAISLRGAPGYSVRSSDRSLLGQRSDGSPTRPDKMRPLESPLSRRRWIVFLLAGSIASLVPLLPLSSVAGGGEKITFRGWPGYLEGRALRPLTAGTIQQRFAAEFPGRIGIFTDGTRTIVLRWLRQATRQLHPSSDCYRGLGYTITWLPMYVTGDGTRWTRFEAKRGSEIVHVRERIHDESGHSWSDASSWYWAALLQRTCAPWWDITVAEKAVSEGSQEGGALQYN